MPAKKLDKQPNFETHTYLFPDVIPIDRPFPKTSLNLKLTADQIQLITKLYHHNLVGLRKISKSKKGQENSHYWLYYQAIPYSLANIFNVTKKIDITPQALQTSLFSLKNYLASLRIYFEFDQKNIGVSEQGVVKIYIDPVIVLTRPCSLYCLQACDTKIKQIKIWYSNIYSRKSLKPSQLPKATSDKKLLVSFSNGQSKQGLPHVRKHMKSTESKNPYPSQEPSEYNDIELYSRINAIRENQKRQHQQQKKIKIVDPAPKNIYQVKPQYKNGYEYDN